MLRTISYIVILICLSTLNALAQTLHTIELKHRSAYSLIPIIEPLLHDNEAVSGQNTLLFIRVDEPRYQELKKIIQKLDAPVKQLLIEIKSPGNIKNQAIQQQSKITITSQGDRSASYHSREVINTRNNEPVHHLRVLDGHRASIEDGKLLPLLSESFRFGFRPAERGTAFSYFKVASRITVLPRLHGNTVTLEITPHYSELDQESNSEIRSQSSATTVVVPLDQWTILSETGTQNQTQQKNRISTRSVSNTTQVRVTVLP